MTIIRMIMIAGTVLSLWFIFSNATATGPASSQQSTTVTDKVQDVVGAINPSSPIANATGKEYDFLHNCIRDFGHFAQYCLLAMFAYGTYFSFKGEGNWVYTFIPVGAIFLVAATDEYVQSLTPGRGAQLSDVMVDMTGCVVGFLIAWAVFAIVCVSITAIRRRKDNVGMQYA
ncbi:MAG: VanZ family protein [Clostridia bacterium]|nr:VanZ family protein [Clostridia bacterium]